MSGKIVGSVRGQVLHLIYPPLVEGTVDYLTAEFSFSGDWDGLSKWAHFKQGPTIYDVPLTNDAITEDQHLNLSAGTWDVYLHGSGDNRRITTTTVRMKVLPYLDEDGEPLPEVPLTFSEVLDQRAQRIQAVAYAVEAGESDRKEAERSRELSEFARVQAEAERTGAEADRASAEAVRASAETARESAEQDRISAENSRSSAENSRSSAEDTRKTNEEARQAAEAIREQNEEARVEAEKNRKDGKSAYQYAVEGGYTGTEAEFAAKLSQEIPTIDPTLTQSGQVADAAAVGDRLIALSEEKASQADLGEGNVVSFKNSAGLVLFTLDLSGLGTPATYGNLVLSVESLTVEEGGEGTFTVALDSAPSANQIVYLAVSDNTRLSVSPATLTFTPENWNTPQTVTVSSAQDDDKVDDSITVTLTSKNVDGKQLVVTVSDNYYVPQLVTDGLGFYVNLRNMSDKNSSDTQIVDSVGGVVCTTNNVAFDYASGFLDDDGLTLTSSSTSIQFKYPLKVENAPNGFTYEITTKGIGNFHMAGAGYGTGYAYESWISPSMYYKQYNIGLARYLSDGTISLQASNTGSGAADVDWTQEHTFSFVNEADGTFNTYVDGILINTAAAPENFERYNVSGTLTGRVPYSAMDVSPMEVASIRIYERALAANEVLENAKFDIFHRAVQTF